MTGRNFIGLERGTLPGGGTRNGLPESAADGYRRFGDPAWDPFHGAHHDPEKVLPSVGPLPPIAARGAEAKRAAREARLAELERLDADQVRPELVTRLLGVSQRTVDAYRRVLRERAKAGDGS